MDLLDLLYSLKVLAVFFMAMLGTFLIGIGLEAFIKAFANSLPSARGGFSGSLPKGAWIGSEGGPGSARRGTKLEDKQASG